MIYTDAAGRPFERPNPGDYPVRGDYALAWYAYRDAITECANAAFAAGLKKALTNQR